MRLLLYFVSVDGDHGIMWNLTLRNLSGLLGNLCPDLDCVPSVDFILLKSSHCSLSHFYNLATFFVTIRIKFVISALVIYILDTESGDDKNFLLEIYIMGSLARWSERIFPRNHKCTRH